MYQIRDNTLQTGVLSSRIKYIFTLDYQLIYGTLPSIDWIHKSGNQEVQVNWLTFTSSELITEFVFPFPRQTLGHGWLEVLVFSRNNSARRHSKGPNEPEVTISPSSLWLLHATETNCTIRKRGLLLLVILNSKGSSYAMWVGGMMPVRQRLYCGITWCICALW